MNKIDATIHSKHSHYKKRLPIRIDYYYENEDPETDWGLNFDYIRIQSKNGREMICPSSQYLIGSKPYDGDDYGLNETLNVFRNGFYCNGPY